MDYSIEVSKVSKVYEIGKPTHQSFGTLRDTLVESCVRLGQALKNGAFDSEKETSEKLWALKNVSFQAHPGEVIGIVGRNGAGKSTLLKVLSRITHPSEGSIKIRGRLASLLEVGTGFHPELTGRENIFLNGALLGMKKEEIRKRFDEIVAFSQIEKFIDTPVKRYSSGMYVRLAFSVAAHLDPDILVLDEVLAVGDLAFQKKCTSVMKDVAQQNRTVFFVSHNPYLIRNFCSRVILLNEGKVAEDGPTDLVLPKFLKLMQPSDKVGKANLNNRAAWGTGHVRIESIRFFNNSQNSQWIFPANEKVSFEVEYETKMPVKGLSLLLVIKNPLSVDVVTSIKEEITQELIEPGQKKKLRLEFPKMALHSGDYSIEFSLLNNEGDQVYDFLGQGADLPFLTITSEEKDPHKRQGYFTLPVLLKEAS